MALKIINTLLVLAIYFTSYLASTNKLGPQSIDLSSAFPFQFMPPGVAFMIAWSLIYVLLGCFLFYMWNNIHANRNKKFLTLFMISSVLHILWLVATAQTLFIRSVVIIILLFFVLRKILDILKATHRTQASNLARIGFGSYYGWISIATWVLGISQALYLYFPDFALSNTRMRIVLIIGVIVTVISWKRRKNIYALIFALWGIGGALRAKFIGR